MKDMRRRSVLKGAAAVGLVGFGAAACGSGDQVAPPSASGGDSTPTPAETAAAEQSPEASGGGAALVATAEVGVGTGVVVKGPKLVVTQPSEGTFKAFTAVCTHQQCLVGTVKDNVIFCPCHGSQYSAEDGSVLKDPAEAPLKELAVKVEGDQVVQA
ncbi:MAG: Rieske 2Fe-2S domain-containing protein [Actinobacteria bacterium]|nr:Rieske 2Fe-2S domain-containing protein [Actinomycetota bacterium]